TPGNIFNLSKFAKINNYDLDTLELKDLLKLIIKDNHYKKDFLIKYLVFDLIELYFRKINYSLSSKIYDEYSYFIKRISDTKRFNLDQESLFIEFQEEVLNG
ncbi:DNA polymerase III, partial [Candidatus Pelagibacter sp.]|nr:DNA polymerase III [Candidatus Pelagibacter sp.]